VEEEEAGAAAEPGQAPRASEPKPEQESKSEAAPEEEAVRLAASEASAVAAAESAAADRATAQAARQAKLHWRKAAQAAPRTASGIDVRMDGFLAMCEKGASSFKWSSLRFRLGHHSSGKLLLEYSTSETKGKGVKTMNILGTINLSLDYVEVRASQFKPSKSEKQYRKYERKPHELELVTPDKTYRLAAETDEQLQEWLMALGQMIKNNDCEQAPASEPKPEPKPESEAAPEPEPEPERALGKETVAAWQVADETGADETGGKVSPRLSLAVASDRGTKCAGGSDIKTDVVGGAK
jgi:hypothetical protein